MGLGGLFLSAFLASTLLPGGSEAALLGLAAAGAAPPSALWLAATAGNTLGGLSSWLLGRWLARRAGPGRAAGDPAAEPRGRRALERVRRWGAPALALSWLPVVGDPLCLAAGWLRVPLLPAAAWMALGKGARYALLLLPFWG
ncbi:MAG: DedA family protein [Gammaproteobacteria bacterium]|nr:MAG: DedA family protein [Gammaproteobacteria bacterium]